MSQKQSAQFSIRDQLVFYGSYHSHPVNVAIHMVFIPIILWSSQALMAMIPVPDFFPLAGSSYVMNSLMTFTPNWATVQFIVGIVYYALLDPFATLLFLPQAIAILGTATAFASRQGTFSTAAVLHIVGWIAQFLGHGVAEKRAPALTDNLAAALLTAPFFVHFEILFWLGYRPNLHKEVSKGVQSEVKQFHAAHNGRRID